MTLWQTDIITVTRLGHTFKASRRTVAHLDSTIAAHRAIFGPTSSLRIIQTCYNTTVAASAGTHDFDACFDLGWTGRMPGLTQARKWLRFQRFLRNHGWGCWWRHTGTWASRDAWHVHGFTLPQGLQEFTTRVGLYVDGGASSGHAGASSSQLADYVNGALGLAGQHIPHSDKTWRPKDLHAVTFNYAAWTRLHGIPKGNA